MSITEIHKLPRLEKVKLMELLWADLSKDDEAMDSPAWHLHELQKTDQRYRAGKEELLDWNQAKEDLRKKIE